MNKITPHFFLPLKTLLFLAVVFSSSIYSLKGQELPDICDEVIVRLNVEKLKPTEVASLICDNKVYISINELFGFSRVKYQFINSDYTIVEGFLAKPTDLYTIDATQNEIIYKDQRFAIEPEDIYVIGNNLYLSLKQLDRVFKFKSSFSYRDLSISTSSAVELPAMKEARILERRLNIAKLTNTTYVGDTLVKRERPLYEFGSLSYSVNAGQRTDGESFNRVSLSAGGQLLGADFSSTFVGNTENKPRLRNFANTLTYVDNSNDYFKQFRVGNVSTQAIATLTTPLIGGQITNRSTKLRNTFETFVISDFTEPFWAIELYVNNVLIDYTQADASGLYTFNVPIVYGRTNLTLRFFGKFGEEETTEKTINIPFSFLPKNEFEYQVTAGTFADESGSMFSQIRGTYGLNRFVTVGGGTEFIRFNDKSAYFPFVSSSVKVLNNLIISSEYAYRTRFRSTINYFITSRFNLNLTFIELSDSQDIIFTGAKRQINAIVSTPIRYKFLQGAARLRFNYRSNGLDFYTTQTQLVYSGQVFGLSSNLTTTILKSKDNPSQIRLRGLTTFDLFNEFFITPEIAYDVSENIINYARLRIRKEFFERALIDFNYTRTFFGNTDQFSVGIRYDFDWARAGANIAIGDQFTIFNESISGGVIYDPYNKSTKLDRNISLNRAFLKFVPFLDKNNNGKKDFNEGVVGGLAGRVNKSRVGTQLEDGSLLFNSLEPYLDYYFELETLNMDNVAYQLDKESYNITLSPNKVTTIEVPIKITGEVAGVVYRRRNGQYQPFSRIKVNILDENFKTVATVLSEFDGYFSYLGLPNGNYTARLDNKQLQQIYYESDNPVMEFTIDNTEGGDILDNLEFYLSPKEPDYDIYEKIIRNINY